MTKARELAKLGEVMTNSQIGGRRNIVINGGMICSQRATSATGVGATSGYFTLDRFDVAPSTNGRATMSQSTDAPDGFANSLKLECTTADTSIAPGEYFILRTPFEGQDLQQFKKGTSSAEKVTVSFYVKGNASATYTCELSDTDNTRHNSQTFAVTTSWNRIILTFVGDTTGAFDNDNAQSLRLGFWLHSGTSYSDGTFASNTWHTADNKRVGDGQTSFFDSTDRTFFLTGLQMEVGSQATPFEHRSFGEELALCQRYFYQINGRSSGGTTIGLGFANISTNSYSHIVFPTTMRSAPSVTGNGYTASDFNSYTVTGTSLIITAFESSNHGCSRSNLIVVTAGSLTTLRASGNALTASTSSFLAFDSEL